jgi:hypothetical protein
MTEERARFLAAAREIARMPGVVDKLLAVHVADPDGRCRGCPSARDIPPIWPCRLRGLAETAASNPVT